MRANLLSTKLHIPEGPPGVVPRPRLLQVLEHSLARGGHRLTMISAPAGYGKTTLLAEWARRSPTPVAWLSLGEDDDHRERFLRYLFAAWQGVQPDLAGSPLSILLGSINPDHEAVLAEFLNTAAQLAGHLAIVLDDYHLLQDPAIHASLAFLLDHAPRHLHFVIGTRAEPALPLARYRARGQLLELSAADLRFSLDEAEAFLNKSMGMALPAGAVQELQVQLEGWAAGLQLAALSLRHRGAAAASGRQRYIADYLSQDVLAQLPPDVQAFLLDTSLLERLTASLVEAVTEAPDGQAMLERLERQNLFVQALDEERTWFRYHPLFADFLQAQLERRRGREVAALHRRAARWYLAHDLPEPAFRHAVAGDDPETGIMIVDRHFNAKLNGGELRVVEAWINRVPAAWYAAYPMFNLMRVGLLAFTGAFEACLRLVEETEQRLTAAASEAARPQLARVLAVRCYIACIQNDVTRAESYAERALRDLPVDDAGFRPGVYGALGDAYRRNGRWEAARECYLQALTMTGAPAVRLFSAHVYGALADLELRQGHLRGAAGYWGQALAAIQEPGTWGHLPLPVIGWVYIRMGELHYERNDLRAAWEYVTRGLQHAELGGDVRALLAGQLTAARLRLAQGEVDAAAEHLERARPLVEQAQFPHWTSQFERLQLELWLAQDRLRAAVHWSDEMLRDAVLAGRPESVVTQLAMARVLIVKGDAPSVAEARVLLGRLLVAAEAEGQSGIIIEALALRALADWRRGDDSAALQSLARALRLAEPEGYVRTFADLGPPMARLLQEARARSVRPAYVETLLAAFGTITPQLGDDAPTLPEPLTGREMDVLRLLAAGLTNREIAEQLVISAETVKKHTANIYGKVGASNRTQAVARARELGVLE